MTTVALLDADIVAYQLSATHQRSYRWPGLEAPCIVAEDFEDLPARIDAEVSKLVAGADADHVVVCLSCPTEENWRLSVLPTYKGNRKGTQKPVHLAAVKAYLEAQYPSYRRPTLEADDIMGILATMKGLPKALEGFGKVTRKVIVSEDKDLKSIPGWLYNPRKDHSPRRVDLEEADHFHLYQTLMGDPVDGYTGLPGCGPVKASALLSIEDTTVAARWAVIVAAYELRGLTEADALVQARVARICRAEDYDFTEKKVKLWSPPPR